MMFLSDDEVATLTGRKVKKLQIEALRKMGLQFFVNAMGRPVVAKAVIEGTASAAKAPKPTWKSNVVK